MINQYLGKWIKSDIQIDGINFNDYGRPFYFKLVNEVKNRGNDTRANNTQYTITIHTDNQTYNFKEEDRLLLKGKLYTITNVDEQPNKLRFGRFIRIITAVR